MPSDIISDQQTDKDFLTKPAKAVAPWRIKTANWLSLVALGCFAAGLMMLVFLYWYAWQRGLYPNPSATPITLGGAWSRNEELSRGVFLLWTAPLYAFVFAMLSMFFNPSKRAGLVLTLSIAFFLITFLPLIGLIGD